MATQTSVDRIRHQYPQLFNLTTDPVERLASGNPEFDALFAGGMPLGHLYEVTGGLSCGKTALLFFLLARLPVAMPAAYIDASGTFFPSAAAAAGVSLERLLVIPVSSETEAVLAAGRIQRSTAARVVVCDLTGRRRTLSTTLLHRLRIGTLKYHRLMIFLTDRSAHVLPPSMMSAQLTVTRRNRSTVVVTVTKSRITAEGKRAEVRLP